MRVKRKPIKKEIDNPSFYDVTRLIFNSFCPPYHFLLRYFDAVLTCEGRCQIAFAYSWMNIMETRAIKNKKYRDAHSNWHRGVKIDKCINNVFCINGYRIYVDILTGENLSYIQLANMNIIYQLDRSSSKWGGNRVMQEDGGIIILASCQHHFIRVHENLVQHPSNNI